MPEQGGNITITDEVGGGGVTISGPQEQCVMASDISENVSNHLMTQRVATNQEVSASMAQGHAFVMEQGRLHHLKRQDEVGAIEGRAVSGVLATPIASPTTQSS